MNDQAATTDSCPVSGPPGGSRKSLWPNDHAIVAREAILSVRSSLAAEALRIVMGSVFSIVLLALPAANALAQTAAPSAAPRKWEVEVVTGINGLFLASSAGGTALLPAPGPTFPVSASRTSRRNPSWYFGDGAALLNEVLAVTPGVPGATRLAPLDSLLLTASTEREPGLALSVRLSRRLTSKWTFEFATDVDRIKLDLTGAGADQLEAARASFSSALSALAAAYPTAFGGALVSSTASTTMSQYEVGFTGGVKREFGDGSLRPYLVAGIGIILPLGAPPSITLVGDYQFTFSVPGIGGLPLHETDTLTVRYRSGKTAVGVVGGGLTRALSDRQGLRLDVRLRIRPSAIDTVLEASPTRPTDATAGFLSLPSNPSIVFSSNPATQPSLGGTAIVDFVTRHPSGITAQVSIYAGYFWRF